MTHIGDLIRKQRTKMKMSTEYIAKQLAKPKSKQAFAKKERTGKFSYELVKEVAKIIGCNMDIFLSDKPTKRVQKYDLSEEQPVTLKIQRIPSKPKAS
jgi:transcriptional regulator with XRE-family HTH domain